MTIQNTEVKPINQIKTINVIEPSFEILYFPDDISLIELAGRTCYKSESKSNNAKIKNSNKINNVEQDTEQDTEQDNNFIRKIIQNGHESVIEHLSATVKIICDRGVTHELVRHRIASYSQVSTRYVNYNKKPMEFIKPSFWKEDTKQYNIWLDTMRTIESVYKFLIESGSKPEQARSVLPNSLKTEIVMTCNFRTWRHIFKLRCSNKAHPDMRYIMCQIKEEFAKRCFIFE